MSTDRDTHFQGFAKLLYEDFLQLAREDESNINEMFTPTYPENWRIKVEQLIAQRAYDLALYIYAEYTNVTLETALALHLIDFVPDFTEWPKPD